MRYGLNIGCGADYRESTPEIRWMNFDADVNVRANRYGQAEMVGLFYDGDTFDEIVANDILEHMPIKDWIRILNGWIGCVRPGGTIRVQVPDPNAVIARYQDGTLDEEGLNRVVYGTNIDRFTRHYQMISKERLEQAMRDAGLEIIESRTLNICAIVVGRKPARAS